jgi:hypothetical protein
MVDGVDNRLRYWARKITVRSEESVRAKESVWLLCACERDDDVVSGDRR